MTSITRRSNGSRFITFIDAAGVRRVITLGRRPKRECESIKPKVEALADAQLSGHAPPRDVTLWVQAIDDKLHQKLAAVGLVGSRESSTLAAFVDRYIRSRTDVKPGTATVYRRTRKHLLDFFGAERGLREITSGDAKDFRRYLLSDRPRKKRLAEDTVRRTCSVAKQILDDALDRGSIDRNPFKHRDIPTATGGGDKSREFFVSRELAEQVLNVLPDAQWQLMFALARYGGLRCPSEVLSLRWQDIDWERERIIVASPKTEHHEGGESRAVPLFPELRPFLDACYELAPERATHCITHYRRMNSNYGVLLGMLVRRAGITMWPKPFQNLRSTRETELAEEFPMHVVCAWIGNSQLVAAKHYLQVTDDHFSAAARPKAQRAIAADRCEDLQEGEGGIEKTPDFAGDCEDSQEDAETSDRRDRTRTIPRKTGENWKVHPHAAQNPAQLAHETALRTRLQGSATIPPNALPSRRRTPTGTCDCGNSRGRGRRCLRPTRNAWRRCCGDEGRILPAVLLVRFGACCGPSAAAGDSMSVAARSPLSTGCGASVGTFRPIGAMNPQTRRRLRKAPRATRAVVVPVVVLGGRSQSCPIPAKPLQRLQPAADTTGLLSRR
ncbi:MAG: phage integrase SAM-like domain-containing protein [Planctomycetaceae bacterium]